MTVIIDFKVSFNPNSNKFDSAECIEYRNPGALAALNTLVAVIIVCVLLVAGFCLWFIVFRKTGINIDASLRAEDGKLVYYTPDEHRMATPEDAP
jgi:hypothetical protein